MAGKTAIPFLFTDFDRNATLEALNGIWEKMKGEDPETIERAIDEAV